MELSPATRHYRAMFTSRSPEELRTVAHIKRFMERLVGDPAFRQLLGENIDTPLVVTDRYGIDIDPLQCQSLFDTRYIRYRRSPEDARWPLTLMWDRWLYDMLAHRDLLREEGNAADRNPPFHTWRERQLRRAASELGGIADNITHPLIAFELSQGCTVGCWFCGLSADRFKGHYPYTEESGELWRGLVTAVNDLFGSASRTGFCYWATDPSDNPDYDRFLEDYYHVTGALPQTTTAAPLKDESLTRRVLKLSEQYRTVANRFSVLTVKHLDKIHAAFTAEELLGVELVLQGNDALTAKANAGRVKTRRDKLRAAGKAEEAGKRVAEDSTIACVSGFLVNMMERTVRMVTPVPGSKRWPLGYRVLGERGFADAAEFRTAIEDLVAEHAKPLLSSTEVLRFRPGLCYEIVDFGMRLHVGAVEHLVRNAECGPELCALISEARHTTGEIVETLAMKGVNVFTVAAMLETLYANGLLDEFAAVDASADRARALELEGTM